jgi:hypothetical protein
MKKTSLTRALFVAGVMAVAGGMAQADAIFYPNGTSVELGENAVENGQVDSMLASGSSVWQDSTVAYDSSIDTTTLGAGPAISSTTTTVTSSPVYVFPNINWDRATVLSQPHPMMSYMRSLPGDTFDRTASATFDSPTRAGEASTMTSGAPNLVTDNPSPQTALVPPALVPDTTSLGAGPSMSPGSSECGSSAQNCTYLPD